MKKIISTIIVFFSIYTLANADEWKKQNKWKISCGLTDKEALVINGKPKKNYNKNSFKVNSAVFKLDKGEIGKCKSDKKPTGGYKYSGRQEITHKLSPVLLYLRLIYSLMEHRNIVHIFFRFMMEDPLENLHLWFKLINIGPSEINIVLIVLNQNVNNSAMGHI